MLIVCPSCASEYTIDPAKLGPDGRTLRCAICRDTWFVPPVAAEPPEPEPPPEPPPGATLLPPAPRKERRPGALSKFPARRMAAIAAAALVAVLGLPLLGEGLSKTRALLGDLVAAERADLSFRQVTSEVIGADGARLLVVEGEIANGGSEPARLPPLEFLVRNGDEQVLATWTEEPPRPTLGPGETTRFASRLASPPADGRQVRVQFTKAAGVAMAAR